MRRLLEEVWGALLVLVGTFLFLLVTWIGLKFLGGLLPDQEATASIHDRERAQAAGAGQRDVKPASQPAIRDSGAPDGESRALPGR